MIISDGGDNEKNNEELNKFEIKKKEKFKQEGCQKACSFNTMKRKVV